MSLKNVSAVIICGGKSQRMGNLTRNIPKTLLNINSKPILWYAIMELYRNGIRKFFFTLGYQGEKIKIYVNKNFEKLTDANFYFVNTGINSNISKRLHKIKRHKQLDEDLILLNSDTIFKMDLKNIYNKHKDSYKHATLIAIEVKSKFGLILKNKNKVTKFTRNQSINIYSHSKSQNITGYVYSGISFVKKKTLLKYNFLSSSKFEIDFFNYLIKRNLLSCHYTSNLCLAADTPKDLDELSRNNILIKIKNNLLKIKKT